MLEGRPRAESGPHFPVAWRTNADRLAGINIPGNASQAPTEEAIEFLTNYAHSSGPRFELLTLGPLSSIAVNFCGLRSLLKKSPK